MIIDAHAHISPGFSPESLLRYMDEAGVDRALLLQGPYYGDLNDDVAQAIRRWPTRFTGAAYLDPWGEQPRNHFRHAIDHLGLQIVKLELSEATGLCGLHPEAQLNDPQLDWLWDEIHRKKSVLVLDLGHVAGKAYQTEHVDHLIRSRPGLKIVIAHLGQPPATEPENKSLQGLWEQQILLAQHPTLWFDLASLPNYAIAAGEAYPYPGAIRWIRRAVALVGSEKLLWGSDAPGVLQNSSYRQLLDYVKDHCNFLNSAQRAAILGGNAAAVFELEKPS